MKDDRCDLLCVYAPRAEEIREGLLGVEAARDAAERALSDPTRLMLVAALFGLWWADPITTLLIAGVAVKEGRESWRGESCCTAPVVADGCDDDCCAPGPPVG